MPELAELKPSSYRSKPVKISEEDLRLVEYAEVKKEPLKLIKLPFLKIKTKDGRLIPFELNSTQKKLFAKIIQLWKQNKPIRIWCLKYRQGGISTLVEAIIYALTSQQPNRNALIMADENDKSEYLFQMSKLYHEKLVEDSPHLAPALKKSNAKTLEFEKIRSQIIIETAENIDATRAFMFQFCHLCLHPDTQIIVNDNRIKKITEVSVGDKVVTHKGRRAIVKEISKTLTSSVAGNDELLSIKTSGAHHFPIICTPKHKIWTRTKKANTSIGRGIWKEARDLKTGDMLGIPLRIAFFKKSKELKLPHSINNSPFKLKDSIPCNYELGYVFGLYLAEGSIIHRFENNDLFSGFTLSMGKGEENILQKVASFISPYITSFTLDVDKESNRRIGHYYGTRFAKLLFNILGEKEEKHISNGLYFYPKDFIRGLIKGYIDGDGYDSPEEHYISITSIRPQLLLQIRDLLLGIRLGYSSLDFKKGGLHYNRNCKDAWILRIHGATYVSLKEFLLTGRKQSKHLRFHRDWRLGKGHCWVRIDEIKKTEQSEYVYDLVLSHEDHSFTTINGVAVHNSEVSRFKNLHAVLGGLMQSVPLLPNTFVIGETTANGMDDFYKEWMRAKEGKTDWIPLFFPWFEMVEYSLPLQDGKMYPLGGINFDAESSEQSFLKEEQELKEEFHLTDEQINWRRFCIINNCNGDISLFRQEFPATDIESFISSGDLFFNRQGLNKQVEKRPLALGEIFFQNMKWEFRELAHGRIEIYEWPAPDEQYVIGGDASEAVGADEAAICVINKRSNTTAAIVAGQHTPEELAQLEISLGNLYNNAIIAQENKGYGYQVNQLINAKYGNIYHKVVNKDGVDTPTDELGFNTNSVTRPQMLAQLAEEIKNNSTELRSKALISECRTFVIKKDKEGRVTKIEAQDGCQDGLVITRAICSYVRNQYPYKVAGGSHLAIKQRTAVNEARKPYMSFK